MPITAPDPSSPADLKFVEDEEYRQLLRVTRAARGGFFLLLIESNYQRELRDRLLDCLQKDLAGQLSLRRMELTASNWEVSFRSLLDTPADTEEALVLIGLENTPSLVAESGRPPARPPVFAFLNRLRETLHRHLNGPLLVWCTPSVYSGLQIHAPDFFDHYAGLFQFMQASTGSPDAQRPITTHENIGARLPDASLVGERLEEFYREQLTLHPDMTLDRVDALLGLAEALLSEVNFKTSERVLAALSTTEEALAILSLNQDSARWAQTHVIRGSAYWYLPTGNREQNLRHAITCYEAALKVYNEQGYPLAWARTQNRLGNAYANLPLGNRKQNLRQAIACYEAALRVSTEQDFPNDWATTQSNLGATFAGLPSGNREQDLRQAIACYDAALRVRTEQDFPVYWATTQNNLGNAYSDLPTGSREQNLRQAIACYDAALRVYTEQDCPMDWAMAQNNLGNAYSGLPTGNREQNLRQAIACYEAALRVRTEQDCPMDWATTQNNLAVALNDLSKECYRNSSRGFRCVGMEEEAQRVESYLGF